MRHKHYQYFSKTYTENNQRNISNFSQRDFNKNIQDNFSLHHYNCKNDDDKDNDNFNEGKVMHYTSKKFDNNYLKNYELN